MFGLHKSKLGKLKIQKMQFIPQSLIKMRDRSQEFSLHSAHRPVLLILSEDFISRKLEVNFQNNTPKATKNISGGAVNKAACVFPWAADSSLSR